MAPFGPPPYTQEQIAAMTSLEERRRAEAELREYIENIKKYSDERNGAQRSAGAGYHGAGHFSYGTRGNYNFYGARGGYVPRGPRSSYVPRGPRGGRGGYGGPHYHPYQRPPPTFQMPAHIPTDVDGVDENTKPKEGEGNKSASTQPLPNNNPPWGVQQQANVPSWKDNIKPKGLCSKFTSTGVCSGICSYMHDPNKLAACKRWLFKGNCALGSLCPLSHDISPHNAPTCIHFQGGMCNNESCRFAHVRINPAARNCEAFGTLGYCEKGDTCPEMHANECPTFANTGECPFGDKCRRGHVRRAARMRTTTHLSFPAHSPSPTTPATPVTSDSPEEDLDTANGSLNTSEECLESIVVEQEPKQFTQQADYISLEE
ncbi:TATA-binding protein-associated factor [Pyrenophora teres f. maculata]|nr:TATA-binding protein-associated factor [Pyrenophora teres f. maculata]